ncbi:hypothetical protein ACHQM5_001875 [Ranunculus cassubicifolius]
MFRNFLFKIGNLINSSQNPVAPSLRFISSITNPNEFTLNYLIKSCGLSPESALKSSQKIVLKSTTGPDSVLALLRDYGVSDTHISKFITTHPLILLLKPDKNLKPKLEFFHSIGLSGPDFGKFISGHVLTRSLENHLRPYVGYLVRSLGPSGASIARILSRNRCRGVIGDAEHNLAPNVKILQDHGVPNSNILKMLVGNPSFLHDKSQRLEEMVLKLKDLGLFSGSMTFLMGLRVLMSTNKPLWDAKIAVYKSFGWSEDEVLSAFKVQPLILGCSTKKIESVLDFFMNNQKLTCADIAKDPCILILSLEKRIIPRCFVVQTLHSKNLIAKGKLSPKLRMTEEKFLKKYVTKFQSDVPDLLKMYQSKTPAFS